MCFCACIHIYIYAYDKINIKKVRKRASQRYHTNQKTCLQTRGFCVSLQNSMSLIWLLSPTSYIIVSSC